jgi:hypothetical protein
MYDRKHIPQAPPCGRRASLLPVCYCFLIWCDDTWYYIICNILSLSLLKKVKCVI